MSENRRHGFGFRPNIRRVLVEIGAATVDRQRGADNEQCLSHSGEISPAEFTAGLLYRFWRSSHNTSAIYLPQGAVPTIALPKLPNNSSRRLYGSRQAGRG